MGLYNWKWYEMVPNIQKDFRGWFLSMHTILRRFQPQMLLSFMVQHTQTFYPRLLHQKSSAFNQQAQRAWFEMTCGGSSDLLIHEGYGHFAETLWTRGDTGDRASLVDEYSWEVLGSAQEIVAMAFETVVNLPTKWVVETTHWRSPVSCPWESSERIGHTLHNQLTCENLQITSFSTWKTKTFSKSRLSGFIMHSKSHKAVPCRRCKHRKWWNWPLGNWPPGWPSLSVARKLRNSLHLEEATRHRRVFLCWEGKGFFEKSVRVALFFFPDSLFHLQYWDFHWDSMFALVFATY